MTFYKNPAFNDWHKQIIMGTILGGSSLIRPKNGKNCHLFMRSSNHKWLRYKATELEPFSSPNPFNLDGKTLRWHSSCYPIFNDFYNLFYQDKKKTIKMEILDSLRDIGLAVWFGDCGRIVKDKVIINTNCFGLEGNRIIQQYFKEVGFQKTDIFKEKKFLRIRMIEDTARQFMTVISDYLQ